MNTLPKPSAGVLRVRLAKKTSMKQAALKRNQNFKKTHKHVVLEQLKQAAPRVALVELITSYHPAGKTWRPPFCGRLVKRCALAKRNAVDALLNQAEVCNATHL